MLGIRYRKLEIISSNVCGSYKLSEISTHKISFICP
jgi:hypothetical protein